MTNFIYNMQDELFDLNMILPVGKCSLIKKLVDHIEAQGKQLRELNAAITKRNATIGKYEREKKELQNSNNYLGKKVNELNQGIRNPEDLTWKQKYDALLQSSEQAIGALQKKCQEYKNSESDAITSTIETLTKTNKELEDYISELENEVAGLKKELAFWKTDDKRSFFGESFDMHSIYDLNRLEGVIAHKIKSYDSKIYSLMAERDKYKESSETYRLKLMVAERQVSNDYISELEEKNKKLKKQVNSAYGVISLSSELNTKIDNQSKEITRLLKNQETLKAEMVNKEKIISSLDAIINHKNKLLDEYMTKCDNLERNYKEEARMKEQFKCICFKHERTIASQNSTIKYLKGKVYDYVRLNAVLRGKLVSIGELANKIDDVILSEE